MLIPSLFYASYFGKLSYFIMAQDAGYLTLDHPSHGYTNDIAALAVEPVVIFQFQRRLDQLPPHDFQRHSPILRTFHCIQYLHNPHHFLPDIDVPSTYRRCPWPPPYLRVYEHRFHDRGVFGNIVLGIYTLSCSLRHEQRRFKHISRMRHTSSGA